MNELGMESAQNSTKTRKIALKTYAISVSLLTFVAGIVINLIKPDLATYMYDSVIYSGVHIIRYVPSIVLFLMTAWWLASVWESEDFSWRKRVSMCTTIVLIVCFAFFSGSFFKAPFLSFSMLTKDYFGPTLSIAHLGGLEFRSEDCVKRGKELNCKFVVSNLTDDDLSFRSLGQSYLVDYSSSSSRLESFEVGSNSYGQNSRYTFIVPKKSNRTLNLFFILSNDEDMKLIPYLALSVSGKSSRDTLGFRNIDVK